MTVKWTDGRCSWLLLSTDEKKQQAFGFFSLVGCVPKTIKLDAIHDFIASLKIKFYCFFPHFIVFYYFSIKSIFMTCGTGK
jgi:hypothetical protein